MSLTEYGAQKKPGARVMDELEDLARRIAAHKMGLVKDVLGRNLPDDLWKQAIPAALRELEYHREMDELEAIYGPIG